MKKIITSGPVIIVNNKLLVTKDKKDDFYKIPGGTLEEGESFEECAIRELKEETGFSCNLVGKLLTIKLKKNSGTNGVVNIELHHYLAKLKNPISDYKSFNYNGHIVKWMSMDEIKNNKYPVAPNIRLLIEKYILK
jgi:8-oxo-dGTP diphosphatase